MNQYFVEIVESFGARASQGEGGVGIVITFSSDARYEELEDGTIVLRAYLG